eukprot:14880618-Alexandrium_andersonii.AAC.1
MCIRDRGDTGPTHRGTASRGPFSFAPKERDAVQPHPVRVVLLGAALQAIGDPDADVMSAFAAG